MTVKSMQHRTGDSCSFELEFLNFHCSDQFSELCWTMIPGRLADLHSGCVLLFMSLRRLFFGWMREALVDSRRERNPELFQRKDRTSLMTSEENNEVNRFLGWAIFSAKKNLSGDSEVNKACRAILSDMILHSRQLDEEYLARYYDPHMSLLNMGGLTLVSKHYFPWCRKVMATIRSVFNEDIINHDPQNVLSKAKEKVMSDKS